jgi:indole-3-glycerol phosphate synthase
MTGFLDDMANSSRARVRDALRQESYTALEQRAQRAPPAPPFKLSAQGFDVIAELKLTSPAAGPLASQREDWRARVASYAHGGAAAVSVLTEPTRFDGSLQHLREAAALLSPLGIPAMRKDFLVDPYQVLEARAAGAGGILVIVRMLPREPLRALLDTAARFGMFVLLEAFDETDLHTAREIMDACAAAGAAARGAARDASKDTILIGINSRDLQTLKVVKERFEALAPSLPADLPAVAESGVATAADAVRMKHLGYRLALVGTALMTRDDPAALLREILAATRTVQR